MEEALIGLLGVLVGLLVNEYFRKNNRIENYSSKVFEKRLQIYEELMAIVDKNGILVSSTLENNKLTPKKKHEICFPAGLEALKFIDANQLYLNEEIGIHIGATFVMASDIADLDDDSKIKSSLIEFGHSIGQAKSMIKSESGVEELNNLFKKITKSKHSSPVIDYFRSLKKE